MPNLVEASKTQPCDSTSSCSDSEPWLWRIGGALRLTVILDFTVRAGSTQWVAPTTGEPRGNPPKTHRGGQRGIALLVHEVVVNVRQQPELLR